MLELSRTCFAIATALVALALLVNVVLVATRHRAAPRAARRPVAVGVRGGRGGGVPVSPVSPLPSSPASPASAAGSAASGGRRGGIGVAWLSDRAVDLALALMTVGLVTRTLATGHAPFANQYEFAIAFAWGVTAALVYFTWRYGVRVLSLAVLPLVLALLLYAGTVGAEAVPLVPALQNPLLLTLHVVTAVLAYGAAGVSFGAAVVFLLRPYLKFRGVPSADLLDEIGYRAVVIAFPLLTLLIILGAIWADIAWGRYWSWDPKETAALVTWLIYGAYLHARVVRDWRGSRAAWLLILGFGAIVFTYFGNLFFGGLHSYA